MSKDLEEEMEELPQEVPLFKMLSNPNLGTVPNPDYEDGAKLPKKLRARFLQEGKPCVPLKEVDEYYHDKKTFIAIGRWGSLHRFSSNLEGCLTLSPNSGLRKRAIHLMTNWLFSAFIIATVLLNSVALFITQTYEITQSINFNEGERTDPTWVERVMYTVNHICLVIYCFELGVKIIAKGLTGSRFSAACDPWTWLDVLVIWTGFHSQTTSTWVHVFKIVPLIPSVRQAGSIALRAVAKLRGMLILLLVLLWGFSLFSTQLYMGTLTQKCIKTMSNSSVGDADMMDWDQFNSNKSNWLYDYDEGYHPLCGNQTGGIDCPEGYTCLQGYGKSADWGMTSFDHVGWSLLSVIRIGTEDFTEDIYRHVLSTNGPWHMLFFVAVFFLITYPMGCLFFSVLADHFQDWKGPEEESKYEVEIEEESADDETNEQEEKQLEESGGIRKLAQSVIFSEYARYVLIGFILLDTVGIASDYYGIEGNPGDYMAYLRIIPYAVFIVYVTELILKLVAQGPRKYFQDRWNHLDRIFLLTFILEARSYLIDYDGYSLAPIRMLKLIQYWPSLLLLFTVYLKTAKALWGWFLYSLIIFGFIIFIGPFQLGQYELERFKDEGSNHRWTFIDFWHSFRMVFRMQLGEWIETLWDIYPYAGNVTFVYYLVANLAGALLISFTLVGVVYVTVKELKRGDSPRGDGWTSLLKRCKGKLPTKSMRNEKETEVEGKQITQHVAYKLVVCGLILLASVALIFEIPYDSSESFPTPLLAIEIIFTVAFGIISLYELVTAGIRKSVMSWGWIFDVLIILENIINLSYYIFLTPNHYLLLGLYCIRAFRPLMLITRVEWLKAPFKGLLKEIKLIWGTVLAIVFVWLVFESFAVHLLAGVYYKCVDLMGVEVVPSLSKTECLSSNLTRSNSDINFDNAKDGLLTMTFLASRMGWVQIVNDPIDSPGVDMARQPEASKMWIFYYIAFLLLGGLAPMGILFSYLFNTFQEEDGPHMILSNGQSIAYSNLKVKSQPENDTKAENEYIPPREPTCVKTISKLVTSPKFEIGVMAVILLDMVLMSTDHYHLRDEKAQMSLFVMGKVILALYTVEMLMKIVCWGKGYFKDSWNYLDMLVVLSGLLCIFLECPGLNAIRIFRLARIFRLLKCPCWGSRTVRTFFSAVGNVRHGVGNLIGLYLIMAWAYALLGNYLFAEIEHHVCIGDLINFESFRGALWTLILLLGFPCLEGIYLGLAAGEGKITAVMYLSTWAALTFLFLLNIYAVLIYELVNEMRRNSNENEVGACKKEISLENVSTENASSNEEMDGKLAEVENGESEVKKI